MGDTAWFWEAGERAVPDGLRRREALCNETLPLEMCSWNSSGSGHRHIWMSQATQRDRDWGDADSLDGSMHKTCTIGLSASAQFEQRRASECAINAMSVKCRKDDVVRCDGFLESPLDAKRLTWALRGLEIEVGEA